MKLLLGTEAYFGGGYPQVDMRKVALPENKVEGKKGHTSEYIRWFKFKRLCKKAIEYGINLNIDGYYSLDCMLPKNYELPNTSYKSRLIRAVDSIYNNILSGKAPLGYVLDSDFMLPRGTGHDLLYSLCRGGAISREFAGYMYRGIPIYRYDISGEQKLMWESQSTELQINRFEMSYRTRELIGTTVKKLKVLDYSEDEAREPSKKHRSHKINTVIRDIKINERKASEIHDKSISMVRLETQLRADTILRVGYREYSVVTSMKKKERSCLELDGEELCEGADMPLGSFTVLINSIIKASKYLPIQPDKRTRSEAYILASKVMKEESPKQNLAKILGAAGYRDKSPEDQVKGWVRNWITKRKEWSKYIDRKGIKKVAMFRGNKLSEYIAKNFPSLYDFICSLQKTEWGVYKNNTMYELLEYLEFQSMRRLLTIYKGIRVHDAVYCKISDANSIKDSMYKEIGVRRKFIDADVGSLEDLEDECFERTMKGI